MRYCTKCGNRLDDFDSYCGNCGAKADINRSSYSSFDDVNGAADDYSKNDGKIKNDKRKSVEETMDDVSKVISDNTYAFICFVCGILSLTVGTFVCAIVSLIFGKKGLEKCQNEGVMGASFCKIGMICSKVSIAFSVIGLAVGILVLVAPLLLAL